MDRMRELWAESILSHVLIPWQMHTCASNENIAEAKRERRKDRNKSFFTNLDLSLQKLPSIAAGYEIRSETRYHRMTVFGFPLDGLLDFGSWRKDVTMQSRTTFSSSPPASVSRVLGLKGNILTFSLFFLLEHPLKLVSFLRNNVSIRNLEMVAKEIAQ